MSVFHGRRGLAALASAALGLLGAAAPARAQQPAAAEQQPNPSGKLVSLSATGSRKFPLDRILATAGLKVGQTVTRADFQAAADRLASTGLFSHVQYRYSSQGTNITLEWQVTDAPVVPVLFDNFPWFADEELAGALRESLGLFDGTAPAQGAYADHIANKLEALLAEKGVQGKVEHKLIQQPDGDGMEQQFRLTGPDLKVASIAFSDTLASGDTGIHERLADLIGKPYSRYAIDVFLIEQVRPVYYTQGFLRVAFGAPQARFASGSGKADTASVQIDVPVTRGARYAGAGATWTGNTALTAADLNRVANLRPGQPADGMAIEAAWDHIREEYGSRGYLDIALDPQPAYDDANGTVSYRVKITEGAPYKMGKLVISGLSVEAEARIRENWLIHPGQPFDLDYFHAFLDEQVQKALADLPVHYDHVGRYLQHNTEDHTVDVMLDFQ